MAGLFDTLGIGTRSLTTYRKAIDVAGHNLANVNTEGYTRQRLAIEATTTGSEIGTVGSGSEGMRIDRLHNVFIDKQVQVENSVSGSIEVKQDALQQALNALNEALDRNSPSGTSTAGISQGLSDFFNALESLSTTAPSIPDRTVVLQKAAELATKFNQTDSRIAAVESGLNDRIKSDVTKVNSLLDDIATLNKKISANESFVDSPANDLRDARQQKIDELATLVKFDTVENENGAFNVIINGRTFVDGANVTAQLETFDPGNGKPLVRVAGDTAALNITGGSIEGAISVRDNQVANLRADINSLASTLITSVNQIHATGFGLDGSTGLNFFNGTNAADIKVNPDLLADPRKLAASGVNGASGDNSVLLQIVQLRDKPNATLNGVSFSSRQAQIVASLGQELSSTNQDLSDQQTIQKYLSAQRDSVSGVSIDEEMANLVMFQKAFQASAKLISMTDEMLATIIEM
jgi:flagellar hook-associated protein 1 FlgK